MMRTFARWFRGTGDLPRMSAFFAAVCGLLLPVFGQSVHGQDALRPFEVRDSIEMAYFGTTASSSPDTLNEDGLVSPDGRYAVKLTHRGILTTGATEGTIWLFDAVAIGKGVNSKTLPMPSPVPLVRMAAVTNGTPASVFDKGNIVFQVEWSEDSRQLTFLGRNGRDNRQLFRVDVASHQVESLTPANQDILAYSRSGSTFAYLVGADADRQAERSWWSSGPDIADVTVGTGTSLLPLLYPNFNGNAFGEPLELGLWQLKDGRVAPIVNSSTGAEVRIRAAYSSVVIAMSPDATQVITVASATREPGAAAKEGPIPDQLKYVLIDVRSGVTTSKLDAPITRYKYRRSGRYRAVWSADGTEFLLTEAEVESGDVAAEKKRTRCVVLLGKVASGGTRCLLATHVDQEGLIYSLAWRARDVAVLRFKQFERAAYSYRALRRRGAAWSIDERALPYAETPLQLVIRENLNEPPVLVAQDLRTGRSRPLFDPNPQLSELRLGSVIEYQWRDPKGRTIKGGLVKPPDMMAGRRYPLVIQTHGFDPSRFFRSGYSDTSNAGRAFTSRDIVVLQVREPQLPEESWTDAFELGTQVYLAAVDQLVAEGLIDRQKVGITGFSYTGWLVATSITRAPNQFAAAALANTDPLTLTGYFTYVDTPLMHMPADLFVGARPYGEGLKTWIERAPAFATDRIRAPVLFSAADPWHLIAFWDMYAAMRDQGKPIELQYFRSGLHSITKPLHKLAHQEMLVDWFDFWLNGHEDADERKADQYARWRLLRTLVRPASGDPSSAPPPDLDSSAVEAAPRS